MGRSAVADEHLLSYLTNTASENAFSIGLILGQSCLGKDSIIHFAKSSLFQSEDGKPEVWNSLADVKETWIAEHAKQASRMLPGGMFVLGIYITSPDDLLNPFNVKIKTILQKIHKELESNTYLYGNCSNEKLVVNYSTKSHKYACKAYDVRTTNVQQADLKFLPKSTKWIRVECYLEIDQIRYLRKQDSDCPLENHMKVTLKDIDDDLDSSVYIFNNEYRDKDDCIENLMPKKSKNTRGGNKSRHETTDIISKPLTVSILQPQCTINANVSDSNKIMETSGHLKIVGRVASKVWLQLRMTVSEASTAVKQDIMRSLASRIEMHLDSLTEEENSEDVNSIHEPPRRVLINLPNTDILLSDYLFPGEGAQDARVSLEELLDIKIIGKLKIQDVEEQADINKCYNGASGSDGMESLQPLQSENSSLLIIGLIIGGLVVIVAIILSFLL